MTSIYKKNRDKKLLKNGSDGIILYYQLLLVFTITTTIFFGGDIFFQIFWVFNIHPDLNGFINIEKNGFVKYLVLHYRLHIIFLIIYGSMLDLFFDYTKSVFRKKIYRDSLNVYYVITIIFYLTMTYIDSILLKEPQIEFGIDSIKIYNSEVKQFAYIYICSSVFSIIFSLYTINILKNKLMNSDKNKRISNAADRYYNNDPIIHLRVHGCQNKIQLYDDNGKDLMVTNAIEIIQFLSLNNSVYKENTKTGKTSILVLHSCQTSMGNENIAKDISANANLLVVTLSDFIKVLTTDPNTPKEYSFEYGVANKAPTINKGNKLNEDNIEKGVWNIYYKGIKVDSFDGATKPIFKNPEEIIHKYEQKYQRKSSDKSLGDFQ